MNTVLAVVCGLGVAAGAVLIRNGWQRRPPEQAPAWRRPRPAAWAQHSILPGAAAACAALGTAVVTGWVVGAVLAAMAAWWLPRLLSRDRKHERRVARIEAIAAWTEMLRDTLAAAAGIEQAIVASAPIAPEPIRAEVTTLAARLEAGHRLVPTLEQLAEDLDDPSADLVVAALSQAAQRQASRLGELLSTLAQSARDQAGMRLRVEAARARTRTSIRVIVITTLTFGVGLVALNREYLDAFDDATGQVILLSVGALFTLAFAWLTRIARIAQPARLFTTTPTVAGTGASNGQGVP
ncbi:type II secretion system F family protein [Phytoactinopolyspora endophytica]|uniref:type II secretion system F family protein n=1 Tax=Phytoactinopolyspora endophytica TaxID=1642495 RepID=UPI00101B73D8|nr:type II secretion system F family protein [Phytoactinopolyspora endophytica]